MPVRFLLIGFLNQKTPLDEEAILSTIRYCIMVGIKPSINNVKREIKAMVTKYGECTTGIKTKYPLTNAQLTRGNFKNKHNEIY